MKVLLAILVLSLTGLAQAATISRTNYQAGQSITAALQNSNENTVLNEINGNLDNDNIKTNAAISMSKLATQSVNQLVVTDPSGVLTSTASPTLAELAYSSGVTSSIQTQINSINQTTFVGLGRNRILNGEMLFDQLNEGNDANQRVYTSGGAAHYGLDMWRHEATGTGKFDVLRSSESLPGAPNNFFTYAMRVRVTTAAVTSVSDAANMEFPMETQYLRDFAWGTSGAKDVTLSFWVLCSSAGTYSVTILQNNASTRSYVTTYTLLQSVWTHVVIRVPGDTTTPKSNWPTQGNTFGLKVVWDLGSGSTVQTSSTNTWVNASVWKAAGTNALTNTFAVWYMTGVQLEIGSTATAFEYVPYDMQLRSLQRYFYKTLPQGVPCLANGGVLGSVTYLVHHAGVGSDGVYLAFPTEMTGLFPATVSVFSTSVGSSGKWYNSNDVSESGTASATNAGATGVTVFNPQVSTDGIGEVVQIHVCVSEQLGGP